MWEDFVQPDSILGLSPRTQIVFANFLNLANRKTLHPLDMRRFYRFIRYAHAHHARINGTTRSVLLQKYGFTSTKAVALGEIYEHGLGLLCCKCPVVREGKVQG
jgi:hypothetical protein